VGLRCGLHKYPPVGCVDCQVVKVTIVVGLRGPDAGKKVPGTKRHPLVDTLGLLLAVIVTPVSMQDKDSARSLLGLFSDVCKKPRRIWVDGGYAGRQIAWVRKGSSSTLSVVLRPREAAALCCNHAAG